MDRQPGIDQLLSEFIGKAIGQQTGKSSECFSRDVRKTVDTPIKKNGL